MNWRHLATQMDGSQQFSRIDPLTGEYQIKTVYPDAQQVTDRNAELRKQGHGNGKDMKLAASIPLSLVHKWKVEQGVDVFSSDPAHKKKARALLNDHQYRMLRIWEGNI